MNFAKFLRAPFLQNTSRQLFLQLLKNYHSISLRPFTGKIFERLLYSQIFKLFIRNKLVSLKQSVFKPGDPRLNQLLAITNEICKSLMLVLKITFNPDPFKTGSRSHITDITRKLKKLDYPP